MDQMVSKRLLDKIDPTIKEFFTEEQWQLEVEIISNYLGIDQAKVKKLEAFLNL